MIPKVLHQIWVGGPPPTHYFGILHQWRILHPEWTYHFWTDAVIEGLNLQNIDLYHRAWCGAMKADVLRYELLYRFGGVYVDFDLACTQPFDDLLADSFFIGKMYGIAMNGVIGIVPGHPFLKKIIDELPDRFEKYSNISYTTGPRMFNEYIENCDCVKCYDDGEFFHHPFRHAKHLGMNSWQHQNNRPLRTFL